MILMSRLFLRIEVDSWRLIAPELYVLPGESLDTSEHWAIAMNRPEGW